MLKCTSYQFCDLSCDLIQYFNFLWFLPLATVIFSFSSSFLFVLLFVFFICFFHFCNWSDSFNIWWEQYGLSSKCFECFNYSIWNRNSMDSTSLYIYIHILIHFICFDWFSSVLFAIHSWFLYLLICNAAIVVLDIGMKWKYFSSQSQTHREAGK